MSSTVIPLVAISHGHNDHIGGLASHIWRRRGWGLPPARYLIGESDEDRVRQMLQAQAKVAQSRIEADIVPVSPTSKIELHSGFWLQPFKSYHRVQTLGYSIWGKRKKLNPELEGSTNEAIISAKKAGKPVTIEVDFCEIAYCGDTRLDVMYEEEIARKARLLLLECTGIDDDLPKEACRKAGHIHIGELHGAAKDGVFDQNEVVLLTHFSARYGVKAIHSAARRELLNSPIGHKVRLLIPGLPGLKDCAHAKH